MLNLSPNEWTAIWLSLRIAVAATTLASLPFGIFTAYALARWRFPGKTLFNGLVHLPLVLPPVVTGFLLLLLSAAGACSARPLRALACPVVSLDGRRGRLRGDVVSADGSRHPPLV